ncbi:MAG TPA: glycoside hydrolase family 15 protein [Polyangia bacterium]
MSTPLEDYALIGDCETAGLVSRTGSLDWLCLPRFDSGACFAALLGGPDNGHWQLRPDSPIKSITRRYRPSTLVLETEFVTETGRVALIDFMPIRQEAADVVRIVEGREGTVPMRLDLVIRFDYGKNVPWVRRIDGSLRAIAGPDTLRLRTPRPLHGEGFATRGTFPVRAGERLVFDLTWYPSHAREPGTMDPLAALAETEAWWKTWCAPCREKVNVSKADDPEGVWADEVERSLITLKALTYAPTGGIIAAPTTSLPEQLGGVRNWDYRYCWLRDATFTLYALVQSGFLDEARAFRQWLLRAAAGAPAQLQLMYGIAGERRLPEMELPWLAGYENSRPVRIGNGAHTQRQLDVFGELLDTMHTCWNAGIEPAGEGWRLEKAVVEYLETIWREPDEGIWEVRGPSRQFTHSKMMAWVALDRAVKAVERFGVEGPVERWRALRAEVHEDVCRNGFNTQRGAFVQSYGSRDLDASLLMMPLVGFLPAQDPRVRGTVEAIERELMDEGFVRRYAARPEIDGLPAGEGVFLLCSFWLVDNLELLGRHEDAVRLFRRVLDVRNDVGLLSESYDPRRRRLVGNFPQAFSHVGLVNTVRNLSRDSGPATRRPAR